jgi:hypothetical protein
MEYWVFGKRITPVLHCSNTPILEILHESVRICCGDG